MARRRRLAPSAAFAAALLLAPAPVFADAATDAAETAASDRNSHDAVKLLEGYAAYKMGHYDEAREIWQALADAGNPNALLNLSTLFDNGQGVAEDKARSAALMRQAAEKGYAPAQLNYGLILERGLGVPRDMAGARMWFGKAAAQGDNDAAFNLGVMLLVGEKVMDDPKAQKAEAAKWLTQAANAGNGQAAAFLKKAEE